VVVTIKPEHSKTLKALQRVRKRNSRGSSKKQRLTVPPFSFAGRVHKLRKARRMSMKQLGKAVGVSAGCISFWERGKREPRFDNLAALARVFEVSPDFLHLGFQADLKGSSADHGEANSAPHSSLAEVIRDAKQRIARLAGLEPEWVKISLDFV
jgi:transcriptional regulator with XRE-family HTH domain